MTSQHNDWHRRLIEGKVGLFAALTTVAISIGGMVEILPMFTAQSPDPMAAHITPYTPLEVAGRDIYIREGCYNCHSQMVRPMRAETLRYGPWSHSAEYIFDRPFQLGSRRLGPDLHRVGGKYSDAWHYEHMRDPRATTPGSVMPPYTWLHEDTYDVDDIRASVSALRKLGHPYTEEEMRDLPAAIDEQARGIVARLAEQEIQAASDKEIIALIAYLQRLGRDGRDALEAQASTSGGGR